MMQHIDQLLRAANVPFFNPSDATLSGSERALACIVATGPEPRKVDTGI